MEAKGIAYSVAETLPALTEPQYQIGGPQSGLPPPYVVAQDVAPYLIVGMDFGTNFCRVSTFANGAAFAVAPHEHSVLVEDILQVPSRQARLVHSVKTCLAGDVFVRYNNQSYTPTDLASTLFSTIKSKVQTSTEKLLAKAVISLPACFTHRQRSCVIAAAQQAGIQVLGLINDPMAAALDVCYRNNFRDGYYLVISSGTYSFEASIVHVQNKLIETKVLIADQTLSGQHATLRLAHTAAQAWRVDDDAALLTAVDAAKKQLSTKNIATIEIEGREHSLSKVMASTLLSSFYVGIQSILIDLLNSAQIDRAKLTGTILAGCSAHLWVTQEILNSWFLSGKLHIANVSAGAAIHAALLAREARDWVVWDALANPIFVAQGTYFREVVAGNSPVPINGHASLKPATNGSIDATILQMAIDQQKAMVPVARIKLAERLENVDDSASVDLSIMVGSDGTLAFAARHRTLDVNLTVEVNDVDPPLDILDLEYRLPVTPEQSLQQAKLEVAAATISGNDIRLIAALIDCSKIESSRGRIDFEFCFKLTDRAIEVGKQMLDYQLPLLLALCERFRLLILQILVSEEQNFNIDSAFAVCDEILALGAKPQTISAPLTANSFVETAEILVPLRFRAGVRGRRKKLLKIAFDIGTSNRIPKIELDSIWQKYFVEDSEEDPQLPIKLEPTD